MTNGDRQFTFEISLSILNHLGRNLYRSFMTVLGEAISNSWDADAENVWIYIDRQNNSLTIKDDGEGMMEDDFQDKFLKIGYSKRKDRTKSLERDRPYIGRKGIGKLALLSCAQRISILSKKVDTDYIGGVIDNSGLDKAIVDDLTPDQYHLGTVDKTIFDKYTKNHTKGTIIHFDGINDGIRNSTEHLKKLIALYFRFSLIDNSFKIHIDDQQISLDCLGDLIKKTQFVWRIGNLDDSFVSKKLSGVVMEQKDLPVDMNIKGFIASVESPRALKVTGTDEKASIDLFVNGRLRERDILRHITRASLVETYLYGQIHFDDLDDGEDRFTSSREGIIADDPIFKELLIRLRNILSTVLDDWDKWRVKHKGDGDSENPRYDKKTRKSRELYNAVAEDYQLPDTSANKGKIDSWVDDLAEDAEFNISSYAECFISENLLRIFIADKDIGLSEDAKKKIKRYRNTENTNKGFANISIEIRRFRTDLSYLSMDTLAEMIEGVKDPIKDASLLRDAKEYKPIRDALAHTALLTDDAKTKLKAVYNNIKARLNELLADT